MTSRSRPADEGPGPSSVTSRCVYLSRHALALLLLLLLLLNISSQALAHATLLGSQPAADQTFPQSPTIIELTFSEPVQVLALRIIDAKGHDRAPKKLPTTLDGRVSLDLPNALPEGRYLVSWRIASLDGHVVGGSYGFAIGKVAGLEAPAAVNSTEDSRRWLGFALRAVSRILLLFAVGTALFHLVFSPSAG